jgi:hypothetical protein
MHLIFVNVYSETVNGESASAAAQPIDGHVQADDSNLDSQGRVCCQEHFCHETHEITR